MKYKARFVNSLGLDIYYEFETRTGQAEQMARTFIMGHNQICDSDYALDSIKCLTRGLAVMVENIEVTKSENEQYLTVGIGEAVGVLSMDDLLGFLDSEHDYYKLPNLIDELEEE